MSRILSLNIVRILECFSLLLLDICRIWVYNGYMLRRKRCDRNYILYELIGPDGSNYIGLTVALGQAYNKSVKIRTQKHISRAIKENKNWSLCNYLRVVDYIEYRVLEVIRGRGAAYNRERELIAKINPILNDF